MISYWAMYIFGVLGGFTLAWIIKGILTRPTIIQRIKIRFVSQDYRMELDRPARPDEERFWKAALFEEQA